MNSLKKYHNHKVARIVGELISDGHMQTDYRYLISFYSKEWNTIKWFESRMKNIFNLDSWIFQDKRSPRYKLFIKSKEILFILNELGVPIGNKTNQSFFVPKWILAGNSKIKGSFLSAIFDSEGYIYSTNISNNKLRWRIGLEFYKNEVLLNECKIFMDELRTILLDFGIYSSPLRLKKGNIRKDGSKSIGVRFEIEKKSFKKFYKYVNFLNKSKRGKLIKALGL